MISTTDAVAASATAKQLGLPRRIVTVIEGESMVNDATRLVVYRFSVAATVTGSFSLWQAGLKFVVSLGGLLIGLVIAWPVAWLHRHLDDAPTEITITLLTPYAVYLVAARAALSRLDELANEAWVPEDALIHLRSHYEKKLEALVRAAKKALQQLADQGVLICQQVKGTWQCFND